MRDIITEISLRFRGTSGQFACEMRNPAGRLARQPLRDSLLPRTPIRNRWSILSEPAKTLQIEKRKASGILFCFVRTTRNTRLYRSVISSTFASRSRDRGVQRIDSKRKKEDRRKDIVIEK